MTLTSFWLAAVSVSPATGYWKQGQDVLQNSAHTLPQGDAVIGIFTPLQYGVLDDLTIGFHPILLLLLTPNFHVRARILSEPVTLSLAASYVQTFIDAQETDQGSAFPGAAESGLLLSFYPTPSIVITPYFGYIIDFATTTSSVQTFSVFESTGQSRLEFGTRTRRSALEPHLLDHGMSYGVGVNWLVSTADVLLLQVKSFVSSTTWHHEIPTGVAMWVHSWENVGIGGGIAFGSFILRNGPENKLNLPVYPVFDFWVLF